MHSDAVIINNLNLVLGGELRLINQYFLHAKIFKHLAYEKLAHRVYRQSIIAMKNADSLSARILFLEGLPNLQDLGKLNIGESPVEIIRCDLMAAEQQHQQQSQVAKILGEQKDFVSQELIKSQIAKNEDYIDWLEEQNNLIFELGVEKFLQKNISKD